MFVRRMKILSRITELMGVKVRYLVEDEYGIIHTTKGKRATYEDNYKFHDAKTLEEFVLVLGHIQENQPERGYLRKIEVPALTTFIKALSAGRFHHKKAHNFAYLLKICSQIGSDVFCS